MKNERSYNHNVSEKVRALSQRIAAAGDGDEIFDIVTGFYADYGVGKLGLNKAFRVQHIDRGGGELIPITRFRGSDACGLMSHKSAHYPALFQVPPQ